MLAQRLPGPLDSSGYACDFQAKWGISHELLNRLMIMQHNSPEILAIYSGYRNAQQQQDLLDRPDSTAAAQNKSTHTTCPATGADLKFITIPTGEPGDDTYHKRLLGGLAVAAGLRWGGGAPRDRDGIPVAPEWHHVDLGPRQAK